MRYFPAFLDLQGRRAIVVGTGEAATRKAEALRRAGAQVETLPDHDPARLPGCAIAIGAEAPDASLRALSAQAIQLGIPVNIVDRSELCSFITPAIVDRTPLLIAISSAGTAPVLARLARARIEAAIPAAWARLANLAERFRDQARQALPDMRQRRAVLEATLGGRVAELVFAGQDAAAEQEMARQLHAPQPQAGLLHIIVAARPEPDLLPLRAQRVLGEADTVIHDPALPAGILELARRDAHRQPATPDTPALLLRLTRSGQRVVRLACREPDAAETAPLTAAGIPVFTIPTLAADPATRDHPLP